MKKFIAIALLCATALFNAPAHADALSDAKTAGQIGEMPDGYLGMVSDNASSSVKALVDEVNAKRKAEYEKIAAKNGQALNVVEKLAGEKTVRMTAHGNYVMDGNGKWIKK